MSTERGSYVDEQKKALEALAKAFEEFKSLNDARIKEIQSKGSASALTEEKVAKANADIERLVADRDRLQKEIDGVKTAMNRPGMNGTGGDAESEAKARYKAHSDAFNKFMRKGKDSLTPEEVKVLMSTDSDPDGGYVVPTQRSTEIVEKVFESSPIAELASIETISEGDTLEMLSDTDEMSGGHVGEQETRSATDTARLGLLSFVAHELYAEPKVTQKLLNDAAFDVEAWIARKVSEKFGRLAATDFVSGNGVKKARGILTYTSGTSQNQIEQIVSGSAATVTADGLIDLQGALKEPYQKNAVWLMKRATRTTIRKLKDGLGNYLWQPGLLNREPDTVLGNPVKLGDDMEALGADALSVAYGDFKAGYQIVRKLGMQTLRDPFTVKGFVLFYTTMRIGGGVKNFEAIKIGKCHT